MYVKIPEALLDDWVTADELGTICESTGVRLNAFLPSRKRLLFMVLEPHEAHLHECSLSLLISGAHCKYRKLAFKYLPEPGARIDLSVLARRFFD